MELPKPLGRDALRGRFIVLEPITPDHEAGLLAAAAAPDIFTYIPMDPAEGFVGRLAWLMAKNASGAMMSYAVRRIADDTIVGSTSYLAIAPDHAKLEIGFTWYRPDVQATYVNPEAKYLLLDNAFAHGWNRVEFKTDSKNARSRAALKKLGATEEGVLRHHMWMPQGYFRDSVYFSILANEWPDVRRKLRERLDAFA
jgi:RimJ/RimL family protein N-acetyltransferase